MTRERLDSKLAELNLQKLKARNEMQILQGASRAAYRSKVVEIRRKYDEERVEIERLQDQELKRTAVEDMHRRRRLELDQAAEVREQEATNLLKCYLEAEVQIETERVNLIKQSAQDHADVRSDLQAVCSSVCEIRNRIEAIENGWKN
jgi:hypothetical protein